MWIWLVLLAPQWALAQGTIRGRVSDAVNGEFLIGANVIIGKGPKGAMADMDGNYNITGLAPGVYQITGSFIGYTPVVEEVTIRGNEVVLVNFPLKPESILIEQAAEVVAKADRTRDTYMENIRKKDVTSLDYISNQQIRRTGDSDAAGAMRRVTGVSTVGNFVFVRGLSDRYIKTTLNGMEVPSINPRRNTLELDIFPTNLIDNLVVVKTQSANAPADWTGAYLNVITRDFPDQFSFQFNTTLGYHDQTTFRNVLSSERGRTDWLGWDDGTRALPSIVDGRTRADWPSVSSPCFYEGLVYMGYAEALAGLGIDACDDIGPANPIGAVANALGITVDSLETYGMGPLSLEQNALLSQIGTSFSENWDNVRRRAPLDLTQSISFGDQMLVGGRELGYIFGFQYKRSNRSYTGGEYGRYNAASFELDLPLPLLRRFDDELNTESVYWNMLLNVSFKANEFNKLSVLAMPNFSGQNESRYMLGFNNLDTDLDQQQRTQRYESRHLGIYQLRGEHFLPSTRGKLEWGTGYAAGRMQTPDLRVFYNNYEPRFTPNLDAVQITSPEGLDITSEVLPVISQLVQDGILGPNWFQDIDATTQALFVEGYEVGNLQVPLNTDTVYSILSAIYPSPTRFYRTLEESKWDTKLHFEQPIFPGTDRTAKLTAGLSHVLSNRRHSESQFTFKQSSNLFDGNPNAYTADENMIIARGEPYVETLLLTDLNNTDQGTLRVTSAYAMFDFMPHPKVRLNAGVRAEHAVMRIRSARLDEATDLTPQQRERLEGRLNDLDVLPSVNAVWQLGESDGISLTNLRASVSRSLARPVFREKAPFRGFDFETLETLSGNPALDGTRVDNFDLRLERFPDLGALYSLTFFYKRFSDPIEQTSVLESGGSNPEYTWTNIPYANVLGLEWEARQNLGIFSERLAAWSLACNLSLIRSRTAILEEELRVIRNTDSMHPDTRPLYGQAPYLFNAMLTFAPDSAKFQATAAFNVQGSKLIMVQFGGMPDIYQQPLPTFDFTCSQQLGEHFTLGFRGINLLNPLDQKAYVFQGELYNWLAFRAGRSFSLSLTYRI
jgi:TonB-dependent receptor